MSSSSAIFSDLSAKLQGEVLAAPFDRGRYATDASAYQMMPLSVVVAKNDDDVAQTVAYAKQRGIAVLPRGGGTSQCGQTVNHAIVIDYSKYLNRIVSLDIERMRCTVEGGIVLDSLNRQLREHGVWFPVDVSTSSRATIGGMTGNNSCGSRSIRYGLMRDNVVSIDALLTSGEEVHFGKIDGNSRGHCALVDALLSIGNRERDEIARRLPNVMRRVGGYNIDAAVPGNEPVNMSHLLVGSEGTLACSRSIELKLSALPVNKVLGICQFPSFYAAMESAQHIVKLGPVAVELIDRTMIGLSRDIALFRSTIEKMVVGDPEALLLVEFAEDEQSENLTRLRQLAELMADLGYSFSNPRQSQGGVIEAVDPTFQSRVFEVRKAGLNIMMSMRDDRKPVSFVEDCAVDLKHLAEYTARLTEIFHRHGTQGTWYAHASVGCLHVRPVLNLRHDKDIRAMRAIAEECFDMVLEYKGSHSGEHGDGICRSEFHEKMFGKRLVEGFKQIKTLFDPDHIMNPGKIVDAPKMDDTSLFRYSPDYSVQEFKTVLDWQGWPGAGGGFQGAVEMCNNNGACRKLSGGTMCPSYRATRDEKHVTRGRANVLRLALSGQLGTDAMISDSMREAMSLCISCKACRRECPTGVDMARMKIEVDAARHEAFGASFADKIVAYLPRYAPWASRLSGISNLYSKSKLVRATAEPITQISRHRPLPIWHSRPYVNPKASGHQAGKSVLLFADTFNTWFEPDNLRAAQAVLEAAGYRVIAPSTTSGERPLCCGRTFLSAGMVDEARVEVNRSLSALEPYIREGMPIVGLEPSCILGMRDEIPALAPSSLADKLAASSYLFEEFICNEQVPFDLNPLPRHAIVHPHCHQKSFEQVGSIEQVLSRIPELGCKILDSGCCGMAGAFGYRRDSYRVSMSIGELELLPAVQNADSDTIVIADGTSCRHQIELGTGIKAVHVARLMHSLLKTSSTMDRNT